MKKTNIYKFVGFLIKLSVIILTFGFIYREIFYKKDIYAFLQFFSSLKLGNKEIIFLTCAFILMFVNWFIEIQKWRLLISSVQKVTLVDAIIAVFSGITVSTFTPNRTGEYFGRVFVLEHKNRWTGVVLTVLGSFSQLANTIMMGVIAMLFFLPYFLFPLKLNYAIYALLVILLFASIISIYKVSYVYQFIKKFKFSRKLAVYFSVLKDIIFLNLFKIQVLSFFRHLVFSIQFFLLLLTFGLKLSFFESFMLTSVVFLIMTTIPTIALTELGVRGAVAIFIFGLYYSNSVINLELMVISAAFALWLINLALPAVIGAFMITRLNFFKFKNDNV